MEQREFSKEASIGTFYVTRKETPNVSTEAHFLELVVEDKEEDHLAVLEVWIRDSQGGRNTDRGRWKPRPGWDQAR